MKTLLTLLEITLVPFFTMYGICILAYLLLHHPW